MCGRIVPCADGSFHVRTDRSMCGRIVPCVDESFHVRTNRSMCGRIVQTTSIYSSDLLRIISKLLLKRIGDAVRLPFKARAGNLLARITFLLLFKDCHTFDCLLYMLSKSHRVVFDFAAKIFFSNQPVRSVVKRTLSASGVWGSIPGRIFRNGSIEKDRARSK